MATGPQTENGYTRIANELFEAVLRFGFTQRQLLVLFAIIRKTYGYGKKTDDMSAAQLSEICGIKRNHVTEVIGQLAQMNVLTRASGLHGLVLGVNKSYRQWTAVPASPKSGQGCPESGLCEVVPNRDKTSPKSGQVDSPKSGHTKENLPKETQKKVPREEMTFKQWVEACRAADANPIPEGDPVFAYADEMEIPIDFIRYGWVEFKRKYGNSRKKYKNWNQHFQNAIRENWYGIWYEKDGGWLLTTRGKQIEKETRARQHESN